MKVNDRPSDPGPVLSERRLQHAVDASREPEPGFLRDRAGHAPLRLAIGGIVVWLGCMTLLSCVGSVISVTEVCGR